MKLERIEITTLPGIEPGFTIEGFDPGVNIVSGPNAVGKSSIIRALEYLLGGSRSGDPVALSLAAHFGNDRQLVVRRTGRGVQWQSEGRASERPPLPDREQLKYFCLSLDDLLAVADEDNRVVDELRKALSGGYDLRALRNDKPVKVGQTAGRPENQRVQQVQQDVRSIETAYAELRGDQNRLPELAKQISEAEGAATFSRLLRQALQLLEAEEKRQGLEEGLRQFPAGMDLFRGDELERLQSLERKQEEAHKKLAQAGRQMADAQADLNSTGLAQARPTPGELQLHAEKLSEAKRTQDRLEQQELQLAQVRARAERALAALGGNEQQLPQLDPDSVTRAENLARILRLVDNRREECSRQLSSLGDPPDQYEVDARARAADALRRWLGATTFVSPVFWLLVFIIVAGAVTAAASVFPEELWLALGGAVASAAAALLLAIQLKTAPNAARGHFEETGLAQPSQWRHQDVASRLREIEDELSGLRQRLLHKAQRNELRHEKAMLDNRFEELEVQKTELSTELGFDVSLSALAFDQFVRLTADYHKEAGTLEEVRATITRLAKQIEGLLDEISGFLERWQLSPAERTIGALTIALAELRKRVGQADAAERAIEEAKKEEQRQTDALGQLEQDVATFYEGLSLEPGRQRDLTERLELLPQWRALSKDLADARAIAAERRTPLAEEAQLLELVQAGAREDLERRLEAAATEAAKLEGLREQFTAIKTRVQDAGHDRALEKALAELDAAMGALAERHDEVLLAESAQLLLEGVERDFHRDHEPEVLRHARQLFKTFTHQAFDLELDEEQKLAARDTRLNALRTPTDLSSATRMQLLLALRLAWAKRIEEGHTRLPLFFDEALTTTDEQRFKQVADIIERLVSEGRRQVFYLCARRSEASLWEASTGNTPHHINLASIRFGSTDAQPADYAVAATDDIPAPDGRSSEEYAALLEVLGLNPRLPSTTVPLYYLLRDDLELLYRLLQDWRIGTLGQLQTLLRSEAASRAIPEDEVRERLASRCAIVQSWIEAWQESRGRQVDRITLEESGLVSENFIEQVSELAESVGGDPRQLIQRLREGQVRRLRRNVIDNLESWLESEGYLDPVEPLSSEERVRRVLLYHGASAEPAECRRLADWLESAAQQLLRSE